MTYVECSTTELVPKSSIGRGRRWEFAMSAEVVSALGSVVSAAAAIVAILAGRAALSKQTELSLEEMRDARRRAEEEQRRAARSLLHLDLRSLVYGWSSRPVDELRTATNALRARVAQYAELPVKEAFQGVWLAVVRDSAEGTTQTHTELRDRLAWLEVEIEGVQGEMDAKARAGVHLDG